MLAACPYFALERITVGQSFDRNLRGSFEILTVLEGRGAIHYGDSRMDLTPGETLLIPEALKRYRVEADGLRCFLTWVPESPAKIIAELESAGVIHDKIAKLGGLL